MVTCKMLFILIFTKFLYVNVDFTVDFLFEIDMSCMEKTYTFLQLTGEETVTSVLTLRSCCVVSVVGEY